MLELLYVEDARAGRAVGAAESGAVGGDHNGFERLAKDNVEGVAGGNGNNCRYVMQGGDFDLVRGLVEGEGTVGGRGCEWIAGHVGDGGGGDWDSMHVADGAAGLGAGGGGRDEGERGDEADPAREKAHSL